MKKTIKIIAVAVLTIMVCLSFASCGNNKSSLNDDGGSSYNGPNKDPKKAEAALEKAGYTVQLDMLDEAADDGAVAYVSAYKDMNDTITIVYYKDTTAAKVAFEEAERIFEELKDEIGDLADNYVCDRADKVVYLGTKSAASSAK